MTKQCKRNPVKKALAALCMAAVLCAGLAVGFPLTAKADSTGISNIFFESSSTTSEQRVTIVFQSEGFTRIAGKTFTVTDSNGVDYVHIAPDIVGGLYPTANHVFIRLDYFTPNLTFDPTLSYSITIEAGAFLDVATGTVDLLGGEYRAAIYPTFSPIFNVSDDYFERHQAFWCGVMTQLDNAGTNGTVTVDTAGQNLDHIMACVFGKLENTSRTLVVKHQGETYTIRGGPDAEGRMNGILLGHNHAFSILGAYRK